MIRLAYKNDLNYNPHVSSFNQNEACNENKNKGLINNKIKKY